MNRRPGIYTYLSGAPNFWSQAKVDHNLRQAASSPGTTAGAFDRASIMLYRFPLLFYVSDPNPCSSDSNPCAPLGGTENLSSGDIDGLAHLYPGMSDTGSRELLAGRREALIKGINKARILDKFSKQDALEILHRRSKK
jgi:hypothetical protein